jgi:hypothetical protein
MQARTRLDNRSPQLLIGFAVVLCALAAVDGPVSYAQRSNTLSTINQSAVRVSITTGGGPFGPPKDRYAAGQLVPVSITMTNTSDEPAQVCVSGSLYQDRPALLKDGQPVSYLEWQSQMLRASRLDKTCSDINLPEWIVLKPRQSRVVDWFTLAEGAKATGAMAWYEPLQPGKYELSIQRRLTCCDGPMMQSNKIRFEVVPGSR